MLGRILDFFDKRALTKERDALVAIEWEPVVRRIEGHVGDHSIYLETRHSGFVKPASEAIPQGEDVVAAAVVYQVDGVEPWETERPAREMAESLSQLLGRQFPVLLSREYWSFVGYYVRIA